MRRRTAARAGFAALVVLASVTLLVSWSQTPPDVVAAAADQSDTPLTEREAVVPERPNATVVTDSQGDRVLEVDEDGAVVWSISVPTPYEAERLGTGDESANGPSRRALTDGTAGDSATGEQTTGVAWVVAFVTGPLTNGLLYVAPGWMRLGDLLVGLGLAGSGLLWLGAELYWQGGYRRLLAAVR